jgi:hypothetical protein
VCSVDKSYVSSASGYYDGSDRLDDISLRIGLPPAVVSCVLLSRSSWTNRTLNSAKSSNSAGPGSPGQLVKRKDFLVVDEEAQNHPNRWGCCVCCRFCQSISVCGRIVQTDCCDCVVQNILLPQECGCGRSY